MDSFVTYSKPRKTRPPLMKTPAYLRSCDRTNMEASAAAAHRGGTTSNQSPSIRLQYTNPGKLMLLCESLHDTKSAALEKKINTHLQMETSSQLTFIISVDHKEAFINVMGNSVLQNGLRFPIASTVLATVMKRKTAVESSIEHLHPELENIVKESLASSKASKSVLVIPVFPKSPANSQEAHTVVILVCLVNCPTEMTMAHDIVQEAFRFCLAILVNTAATERERYEKEQSQALLGVARRLFNHLANLDSLLQEIMTIARTVTKAERCSLFLVDHATRELVAKVFDGHRASDYPSEVRISKDQGIAGHVAVTGKLLNITDAYSHPLFYQGMDNLTGFRTTSILCFPIRDETGVVGVAQLCNKSSGPFDKYDEEAAMAISIYCGISIMHSVVYKRIQEAQHKSHLCYEMMLYHMKPSEREVEYILKNPLQHNDAPGTFTNINFNPRAIPMQDMARHVVFIFEDLCLLESDSVPIHRESLIRFILYVNKGYRCMSYHNFTHAFSVTHFAYILLKHLQLIEAVFTPLEAVALITSCLCHDLDHRGTTSSYHLKTQSDLASLYSSEGSVMEQHHLSQALHILNTPGCGFLERIKSRDYTHFIECLRSNILATDLAVHLKNLPDVSKVAKHFNPQKMDHRRRLMSLIMTCSDLNDQTKGWAVAFHVAKLIFEEFFIQGDMEKEFGVEPMEMMDRTKASIPDLQIAFLTDVCIPTFMVLAEYFPKTEVFVKILHKNVECWTASREIFEERKLEGVCSLDLLLKSNLDVEVGEKIQINEREYRGYQHFEDDDVSKCVQSHD